ncbi:MAG: hypothetical protein ABIN74_01635 [Ferruginibacter sp.]
MKKLFQIIASIALFTVAVCFTAHTDPVATTATITALHGVVYAANYFGFISLPFNAFGEYVAGVGSDGSAGVTVINSERARGAYMHIATNPKYAGKRVVQSYLRLEATIKNNANIITFKTFEGDGASVYGTEVRLDRNDAFVITDMSVKLLKQDIANLKTNGKLHAYPNITVFGAAAAADLFALYQGYLTFTINKTKELVSFDCQRFLQIPRTQQSGAANYDDVNGGKAGFVKLTPHITLDGSGTNELELKYPSYAAFAGGTSLDVGFEHRAVLYLKGLLITGGSANT